MKLNTKQYTTSISNIKLINKDRPEKDKRQTSRYNVNAILESENKVDLNTLFNAGRRPKDILLMQYWNIEITSIQTIQ